MKLILLAASLLALVSAECNYGDTEYDGYCYQFVNQRVLFPDAKAYCAAQGGVVVRIRGASDGRWLISNAITKFHATYGNFWIGLHKENGKFLWDDGAKVDYLNWAKGYPFSGYDFVGAQLSNTQWVSVLSSQRLPFICYYQQGSNGRQTTLKTVTQSTQSVCDGADLQLGRRCYFFNPTHLPYQQAKEACEKNGKTLAVFDNLSQINFVTSTAISKFSMTYGTFWIGLVKNDSDGKFYWADSRQDNIKFWSPGYPFQHQNVVSQQVATGRWKTSDVTAYLPSVCSGSKP